MPGKFIKIKCDDCNNTQVVFDRATTVVKCEVCGTTLARPTGGKAHLKGTIVEVLSK